MLQWLYTYGDWRAACVIRLPRAVVLHIRARCRVVDWRIGVYVEPGSHRDELGFVSFAPVPMLSLLFALYRVDES